MIKLFSVFKLKMDFIQKKKGISIAEATLNQK